MVGADEVPALEVESNVPATVLQLTYTDAPPEPKTVLPSLETVLPIQQSLNAQGWCALTAAVRT
jgi:hypothetical protein